MRNSKSLSYSLVWIVASVILFFTGLVVAVTSKMTGVGDLGTFIWVAAALSMLVYVFYSAFLWFKLKKGSAFNNLVTAYIILAFLFVLGGLVGAVLTYPDGLNVFFGGLGMLAFFWIVKLFTFIFSKESDFQ